MKAIFIKFDENTFIKDPHSFIKDYLLKRDFICQSNNFFIAPDHLNSISIILLIQDFITECDSNNFKLYIDKFELLNITESSDLMRLL